MTPVSDFPAASHSRSRRRMPAERIAGERKKNETFSTSSWSHIHACSLGPSCLNTCCSLRNEKKKNPHWLLPPLGPFSLLACFSSFLPLCPAEGRVTAKNRGSAESWIGRERGWGSFSLLASCHVDFCAFFFPFSFFFFFFLKPPLYLISVHRIVPDGSA